MSAECITKETYYVVAEVVATEDFTTKKVTVKGLLGLAPNGYTPIKYPVRIYDDGYLNKTQTRAAVTRTKRQLLEQAAALGYTQKDFTEPLRVRLFWEQR
jgi:hypothetical protein